MREPMELFKSKLIYPKLVKTICFNATLWFCLIAVSVKAGHMGGRRGRRWGEGAFECENERGVEKGRRNHSRSSYVGKSKLTGLTRQHLGLETGACKTLLR